MPTNRPTFVETPDGVITTHGDDLRSVVGAVLTNGWIAWDQTDNEWFCDEAIILCFGDCHLEASFNQLSQLSITWNTVDVSDAPHWDGFSLEWRENAHPAFAAVIGKQLIDIGIVEYRFRTKVIDDRNNPERIGQRHESWLLHALEFRFTDASLTLYNALDENGMQNEELNGDDYLKHWIKRHNKRVNSSGGSGGV